MSVLKSIYADLLEKRLWPVAIALLVALITVPWLLGRGSAQSAHTPTTAQLPTTIPQTGVSPGAASERAEIGVETAPVPATKRPGAVHDPFAGSRTRRSPRPAGSSNGARGSGGLAALVSGGGTGTSGGSNSVSSSAPAPSSATASSPPAPATTPSAAATTTAASATTATTTGPPAAVPASQRTLKVTLGVSPKAGARIDRRPGSLRLAPLPSATDPVVLFLGVLEHTRAAVFMLPDGATAQGEGRCVPRPGDCQTLELPVGGESYVDVPDASGGSRELRLTVPGTTTTSWSRVKQATTARERVSKAGLALVRAAVDRQDPALSYYRFSKRTGLLVRHKQAPKG